MAEITDALVLMAGTGSRLRASLPKPLVPILGRPLVSYIMEALQKVGVRNLHVVVGANGDALVSALQPLVPATMELHPVLNPDWQKQNGLSVLRAAGKVREPFFLTMGDHLFDSSILTEVAARADRAELNLAVDRKINSIFDLEDAMKVQMREERVVEIGKELTRYNAIDTGIFLCPNELFDYLRRARKDGDCSLADGVRAMANAGKVRAIDIGDAWWQDVDTAEMYAQAAAHLREAARAPA
ncbi:MAG TPA: NTP transferase domain-containing protein [Chthoniobacterales bacterium]|jgi:choline kinase